MRIHKNKQRSKKKKEILNAPVQEGFVYEICIDGLGTHGEGVGRVEGFTVFVPFALPGEVVKVHIDLVKKNYGKGHVEEIVTRSPHRVEAPCPVYGQCGGCQLQHVAYEEQLRMKKQIVMDMIKRIGKCDPHIVKDTIGQEYPWQYRNKMQLPVGGVTGRPELGFYATESHRIVHFLDCHIQAEQNNELARRCYEIAVDLKTPPYDEKSREGVLRHVIGRVTNKGQVMVILVTAKETLPLADEWVKRLRHTIPHLVSVIQNYNPKETNVIMGECNTLLWGEERIDDEIGDLTFSLSPHSFFQVNPRQTEVLYNKALEYGQLKGDEVVIDAYCGTGTISLFLAKRAKHVIGIEIVEPAVLDARKNGQVNYFQNVEFINGDATEVMPKLYKDGLRPDVIFFDPTRAGCKEEVLVAAAAMNPDRIVYVSCNPASMARDMGILKNLGYDAVEVTPVDMFPMTGHVESIALIVRSDT